MVKKRSHILLLILGLSFLIVGLYLVRPHNRLLLTLLPPTNLYKHIVKHPITVKEKNVLEEFVLKHDYVGTYHVGILMKNPPAYGMPIISNAKLKLTIIYEEDTLFEENFSNWSNRFGGPGKTEAGVILGYYKVPENIPMGLSTEAVISIVSPDPTFEETYGALKFFIKRSVDQ